MPSYNFKRKVKFYVVDGTKRYKVDIFPDLSFSQTFKEESRKVKTLHAQTDMFDGAIINEANPANFEFTMPLYVTLENSPVLDLLLDYDENESEVKLKTADIYVDTSEEIFKLEKAVFERGVFNISRAEVVSVSLSGTASKLLKFGPSGTAIPGVLQPTTSELTTYLAPNYMWVKVGSATQPSIVNVSVEVSNDIQWIPNNTLHKSLEVTGPSDTTYPEAFVVSGRNVSGTIQQYITDENIQEAQTWAIDVPLSIGIATSIGSYVLQVDLPNVVYTNTAQADDIFVQNYTFRSISNPDRLSDLIQYVETLLILTEGDQQSGQDYILLEGDMQTFGSDGIRAQGDV